MPQWQHLFSALRDQDIKVSGNDMPRPVGGGDISSAWRVRTDDHPVFLKTGPASSYEMFLAESEGLKALDRAGAIRVPKVIGCVCSRKDSLLALEWIEFEPGNSSTEQLLGKQLALQHRCLGEQFGWHRDNTLGSTPQHNAWNDDWVSFFAEHRLGFQLELAAKNGFAGNLQPEGRQLLDKLGYFFSDYWPEPSLLHGDLWGGNWASSDGRPVVFDPAVYYGDRESDIAMTKLFGGFGREFYAAYEKEWPTTSGSEKRVRLYQLYHVLNHLNLFGAAYLARAQGLIRELL